MIDRFSRYAMAIPLKNSLSPTVINAFTKHWIYTFGVPEHILSDNGPQFKSWVWRQFQKSFRFKQLLATAGHPQTNGMIERLHRYIKQRLVLASADQQFSLLDGSSWKELIPPIMFAYNSTVNRMMGYSPHELVFNRSPRFPIDLELNIRANDIVCTSSIEQYREALANHQRAIFQEANILQNKYDVRRKKSYDRGRLEVNYDVDDYVTYYAVDGVKGKKGKFALKWRGIWVVIDKFGSNALLIRDIVSGEQKRVNISKVKPIHWIMNQDM